MPPPPPPLPPRRQVGSIMPGGGGRRRKGFPSLIRGRLRRRSRPSKLCQRRVLRRMLKAAWMLAKGRKAILNMRCPKCSHGMLPVDHPTKFMLRVCTSCGHEKQDDFEFSWHRTEVNGIKVVPRVKDQGRSESCVFYAVATALEGKMKLKMVLREECYKHRISVTDLKSHFESFVKRSSDPLRLDKGLAKFHKCEELLKGRGVLTEKGYKKSKDVREASDHVKIRGSRWHYKVSFEEVSALVLEGKMLAINVPDTEAFHSIGYDGIYEYDLSARRRTRPRVWHALVIVGFGVRNGKNYFVVQNSHGKDWGDSGF